MDEITQKKRQFERLSASIYDFGQANFGARYLLKKGWHSKPWERRGTIYQQQTAFVTNLIVAYARPFTESKGWPAFPPKLTKFFNAEQREMHDRLLQMRHEIFAHSDSQHFEFRPEVYGSIRSTLERVPFAVLSADEAKCIKVMTDSLIKLTNNKIDDLHDLLAPSDSESD